MAQVWCYRNVLSLYSTLTMIIVFSCITSYLDQSKLKHYKVKNCHIVETVVFCNFLQTLLLKYGICSISFTVLSYTEFFSQPKNSVSWGLTACVFAILLRQSSVSLESPFLSFTTTSHVSYYYPFINLNIIFLIWKQDFF